MSLSIEVDGICLEQLTAGHVAGDDQTMFEKFVLYTLFSVLYLRTVFV